MKTMPSFEPTAEVHISSLVVQARPETLDDVVAGIDALGQAEVHGRDDAGKLIVVLETENDGGIREAVDAISALAGVLSVNMVFHQIEDGADDTAAPTTETAAGSDNNA